MPKQRKIAVAQGGLLEALHCLGRLLGIAELERVDDRAFQQHEWTLTQLQRFLPDPAPHRKGARGAVPEARMVREAARSIAGEASIVEMIRGLAGIPAQIV